MEAMNSAKKPAHGLGETRKKNLSSKTLLRPMSAFKSKLRAFVRKLAGKSKKEKVDCNSPNVEPVSSGTLVMVPDVDLKDVHGISASDRDVFAPDGAVNATSLSPLLGEETFITTSLQEAKASTQVIEFIGDDLTTVVSTTDFGEQADDVPHRVKSKLPSEETLPFIEPGSVRNIIKKLNSVSCFEFRQASLFLQDKNVLQQATTGEHLELHIDSCGSQRLGSRSTKAASDISLLSQSSCGCGTSDLSHTSEALEINTSERVALLRCLFQEEDSPSFFQCGFDVSSVRKLPKSDHVDFKNIEEPTRLRI
ncbi:hypothetical protein BWQ96_00488 [Gracilariopsis chorda]|uniref:Uncharacterized protein n=1 Tax=Gracilariopsis chorda TaxID=448386 RepID=A0A2V3J5Y4_9FLOR|nr:hypothetical protein BWQ96_00488 [Gracilariopsis chorda]|eukprot:PXF49836.1 hypothetical protein BWQ96_00488 [Gracilariopsis chorda]